MADKKISELDEIIDPKPDDELLFLDSTNSNLKKVKFRELAGSDEFDKFDYPYTILGKGITAFSEVLDTGVISANAFKNVSAIKGIHIGSKVTGIGTSAFQNHSKPDGLTFSEGVISIGDNAFYGNGALGEVQLPDSLTSIGNSAFKQVNFSDLKLGKNLLTIGSTAFGYGNYSSMNAAGKTLEFPDSLVSLASSAFVYSNIKKIKIGKGITSSSVIKNAFPQTQNLTSIEVSSENTALASVDGCLYDKNLTSVLLAPSIGAELNIPSTCTSISSQAGYRSSIASLSMPEGFLSIGSLAFFYGTLGDASTSITFPTSLTGMGNAAFGRCAGFGTITVPNGEIGSTAFYFTSLKTGTLGTGVTSVGDAAFSYSSLERLNCNIPLTSIGNSAFTYTSSNLVIHARASDSTWTAGTNLSIKGNTSVDVIKDL